jgi:1-acyl-sn-glycerol-3-phosphate acyltransferase
MDYRNIRKSKGWIYNLLLPSIHLEYRKLFQKIHLHNRKGVPANKPVLIASNHPTAFIDPLFFCIFFDPPVYNMTRGDIFRKPFFRKLLEHCNMFPVYRQRDGYDKRDRNDEVFEYCQKKLVEGVAVNIFVEGEHHLDKRVLSMQKGIARIAFGTYENHPMDDLQIVPVGCNYSAGDILRDEAKVNVGAPIFVKDYWEKYRENPGAAINSLCGDIRKALITLCYHIENRNDDALAEHLLTLWRNDHPVNALPVVEHTADRFKEEKKVLDCLNSMPEDQKRALEEQTNAYFQALKSSDISDKSLMQPQQGKWSSLLFLVLGFLPMLVGFVLSFPIQSLALYLANTKVKKREFRTSILVGIGVLGNFFYYLSLLLVGLILQSSLLILFAVLLPALSWFSIYWSDRLSAWRAARRVLVHPERSRLLAMRSRVYYT